jgi:hypothetical protein
MVAMNVWPTDAADGSVATEARWRKMARQWVPSGVCAGVGAEMQPTLAGVNLTVKAGACWVDGHFCELPGDQVLTATANGLAVVRFDPAANSAQLLYLDGVAAPSQSPTGIYELPIAKITGSVLADQRAVVTSVQTPWIAMAPLTNGWVAYGAPYQTPRYRKIGDIVYVEGWMKSGTVGQVCYTLPVGFRPTATTQFVTASQGAVARIGVDATGAFFPAAGGSSDFILNCSFSTLP